MSFQFKSSEERVTKARKLPKAPAHWDWAAVERAYEIDQFKRWARAKFKRVGNVRGTFPWAAYDQQQIIDRRIVALANMIAKRLEREDNEYAA